MVDGDDLAVALDEPARLDRRRVAHFTARAAASAAAAGSDPARTKLVPPALPLEHGAELRRELVRGQPVERDGRQAGELRCRSPDASALRSTSDDPAEPLAVEHERGVAADEPDVASRQADERVGRDDGEVRGGRDGVEPGHGRRARALVAAVPAEPRSTTFAPAGGATSTSPDGDGAVGDVRDGELEHGRGAALRVDADTERHALRGVPGELDRAEQAAVVLRRDR